MSLVGYSPWGCKESDMTEPLHFTSVHFICKRKEQRGGTEKPLLRKITGLV